MRSKRSGLTLLELLLVVLLLTGGIIWLLQANYLGIRTAHAAYLRLIITKGVLEYQLELLRGQNFDTALPIVGWTSFLTPTIDPTSGQPYIPEGASAVTVRRYRVEWDDSPINRRKRVTVEVTWTDPFGHSCPSTLSTFITDPTP